MQITKTFQNGCFQAIRIPLQLDDENNDIALEIERVGDEIRLRPVRRSLDGLLKKFACFGPDFMKNGRGDQSQVDREAM